MAKKKTEEIVVKSIYCERLSEPITQKILNKSFPIKTGYWISRAIEKIRQETKAYSDQRNKLVEDHKKGPKEYTEEDKKRKLPPGQVIIKDMMAYEADLAELQTTELKLGISKIEVDLEVLDKWFNERKEPGLTVAEMEYLLPFFEITGS